MFKRLNLAALLSAKKEQRHVVERWVFAIGLSCCLLGLVGLLRWGPSDPVEKIRLDGTFQGLSAAALWPELQDVFGQDLLAVDLPALVERLEKHPWVAEVTVRRVWPNSLIVDVQEPEAIARWHGLKAERGFVAVDGAVLEAAEPDSSLPLYVGPAEKSADYLLWQQHLANALAGQSWQVLALQQSEYGQWRAQMQDAEGLKVELRFGHEWNTRRWQQFSRAWQAGFYNRKAEVAYVDLRYRGGMAVGWQSAAEQAALTQTQQPNFDRSMWVASQGA